MQMQSVFDITEAREIGRVIYVLHFKQHPPISGAKLTPEGGRL